MNKTNEIKYKSIQKAVAVLNCFTEKSQLGVTEISNNLGLNKSNAHDILTTFKALDYLEQDENTGKYKLSVGVFKLCRALEDNFTISKIAVPFLQEIANITNERVYLAVPHNDEVLYLQAMYPANSANLMRVLTGERAKMYCTGIGKAMMAYLPYNEVESYLDQDLEKHTDNTIVDKEIMLKELQNIRKNGYSIDDMEHEYGIKCVGVPIFDKNHKITAAMSVSGPSLRFDDERITYIANLLKDFAFKIEEII